LQGGELAYCSKNHLLWPYKRLIIVEEDPKTPRKMKATSPVLTLLILLVPWTANCQGLPTATADTAMARMLYNRADGLQRSAHYDSAIVFYDSARATYEQAHLFPNQIRCLIGKSACLQLKGNYDKALEALGIGPEAERRLLQGDPGVAAMRFVGLGQIYRQQGKYDTALAAAHQAFDILHEYSLREDDLAWEIFSLFAGTYSDRGELDSALAYNNRALLLFPTPEGEQRTKVSNSYNSIAGIYQARGDYLRALTPYMKALEILRVDLGEKHPDIAGLYNNIAVIYMRLGDYDLSLEYHLKSLAILDETLESGHPAFGIRYNNIAMVYRSKGEFDKALEFGEKSKAIFVKKLGAKHPNVAGVVNNIGRTYADMKEYKRALESYEEALTIWEEKLGQKHPNVTQSYFNIGEAYGKLGDPENAVSWLEKSLRIRRETLGEKNVKVAQSYNGLASVYAYRQKLDSALQYYQMALIALVEEFSDTTIYANPRMLKSPSDLDLLASLSAKGETLNRRYEGNHQLDGLKASLDAYECAAQLVETIRHGYGAEGSKLQLGRTAFNVYEQAVRVALKLFDITGDAAYTSIAFSFAERSKAGVLRDAIAESHAQHFTGIPDSLLEQESGLRMEIAYDETQLQKEKEKKGEANVAKIARWESAGFESHRKYAALVDGFEKHYPAYHSLKYQTNIVSPQELQKQMSDDKTMLLEYIIGDSTVTLFAVTKNRCIAKSQSLHSSLTDLVTQFRRAITNLDVEGYVDLAHRLHTYLLAPVREELKGIRKLIIIPDGILNYLPFEALLTKPARKKPTVDFSGLPYLIRDFEISYQLSARFLLEGEGKTDANDGEMFAGWAPVFADKPWRASGVLSAAVKSGAADEGNRKAITRSITVDGERFAELKESENEVTSIEKLFEVHGRPAKVFLRGAAKESELKSQDAETYRFIHIATHGLINEEDPKLSGIIFAAPDSGSSEDGVLYAGEVYNLRLNADLVVLSACQTGLGTIAKGEGILGLTRGFMYAGARNVLVSLWQVADKSTADLMVQFYRNILMGQPYSTALRKAKLSLIAGTKYAHPVEWSPFVLTGH
jgi:CHAT domain-containing protein/Tfp pilus assembly protein PilF